MATAQRKANKNYMDFSKKPYYFGITLGYNQADYRIIHSTRFIQHDSIKSATSRLGPGFNLGIVGNLNIGQYFDIRTLPTLSFANRKLVFKDMQEKESIRSVESVFVELPFQVRYKSKPFYDVRWFVTAGVKYGFDVASNSRARQANTIIKIAPSDFSVEYGTGFQIFLPYFILSPEFKISQGVGNVLIYDEKLQQSSVLERLLSRTFTFSFHFEG